MNNGKPKPFLHTFSFQLTEAQYKIIEKEFLSCQLGKAAMLGQPAIWFGGQTHIRVRPPMMKITVVSADLYNKLQAVLTKAHTGKKA